MDTKLVTDEIYRAISLLVEGLHVNKERLTPEYISATVDAIDDLLLFFKEWNKCKQP
jgi:hypothetical protein